MTILSLCNRALFGLLSVLIIVHTIQAGLAAEVLAAGPCYEIRTQNMSGWNSKGYSHTVEYTWLCAAPKETDVAFRSATRLQPGSKVFLERIYNVITNQTEDFTDWVAQGDMPGNCERNYHKWATFETPNGTRYNHTRCYDWHEPISGGIRLHTGFTHETSEWVDKSNKFDHLLLNNQHYYFIQNVTWQPNETKTVRYEYRGENSDFKWDTLFGEKDTQTINLLLDPFTNSSLYEADFTADNTTYYDFIRTTTKLDTSISYVPLLAYNHLNETGAQADELNNNYNFTCSTCPSLATGIQGNGLDFDGSTTSLNAANESAWEINGTFTVSLWLKADTTPTDKRGVLQLVGTDPDNANGRGQKLYFDDAPNEGQIVAYYSEGDGSCELFQRSTANTLDDGNWHHIVIENNVTVGNNVNVWIDGSHDHTVSNANCDLGLTTNMSTSLGDTDANGAFDGVIDEFMVQAGVGYNISYRYRQGIGRFHPYHHDEQVFQSATIRTDMNVTSFTPYWWGDVTAVNISFDSGSTYVRVENASATSWTESTKDRYAYNLWLSGNQTFSNFNMTISASGDTTPPLITNVQNTSTTNTSTIINWTTDENSNSSVNYGTTTALGTIISQDDSVTLHNITLTSLTNSTLYHYNITSCDALGNCNTSGPHNFTTQNSNLAPIITSTNMSIRPVNLTTDLELFCNATDADGDTLEYEKQWYKNNNPFQHNGTCKQGTANVSTTCGGLNTGSYNNISTSNTGYISMNYTKPARATNNTVWQVTLGHTGGSGSTVINKNVSLPFACWQQNPLQLRLYSTFSLPTAGAQCYNGTAWTTIVSGATAHSIGGGSGGLTAYNVYDDNRSTCSRNIGGVGFINTEATATYFSSYARVCEETIWWDINVNATQGQNVSIHNLSSTHTTAGDVWIASCRANDGTFNSTWVNTTGVNVSDQPWILSTSPNFCQRNTECTLTVEIQDLGCGLERNTQYLITDPIGGTTLNDTDWTVTIDNTTHCTYELNTFTASIAGTSTITIDFTDEIGLKALTYNTTLTIGSSDTTAQDTGGGGGGSSTQSENWLELLQPRSGEIRRPFCETNTTTPNATITLNNPLSVTELVSFEQTNGLVCDPLTTLTIPGGEKRSVSLANCQCPQNTNETINGLLTIKSITNPNNFIKIPMTLTGSIISSTGVLFGAIGGLFVITALIAGIVMIL